MSDTSETRIPDDAPRSANREPMHSPDDAVDLELVGRTVTIMRPEQELREFWRDGANLELLFRESKVDWTGVRVRDVGEALEWGPASNQDNHGSGRVEFRSAPAGRGTEVTLTWMLPARGPLTKIVEKLTKADPRMHGRRALRRFKQLMEAGEMSESARNLEGTRS